MCPRECLALQEAKHRRCGTVEGKGEVVHPVFSELWAGQNEPKLFHPRLPWTVTPLLHHIARIKGLIVVVLIATLLCLCQRARQGHSMMFLQSLGTALQQWCSPAPLQQLMHVQLFTHCISSFTCQCPESCQQHSQIPKHSCARVISRFCV